MKDVETSEESSQVDEEMEAYHEEAKPKRDYKLIVFGVWFLIIFGLLAAFLITTNQNFNTGSAPTQQTVDPALAAKLQPLQEQLSADPDNVEALIGIGFLFYEMRDYDKAEKNLGKAVKSNPERVDAIVGLGMAYEALFRPNDAKAQFDRALEIEPTSEFAKVRKAYFLAGTGESAEAVKLLREVVAATNDSDLKTTLEEAIAGLSSSPAE